MTIPQQAPPPCPACAGPQMLGHPAGILTYQHDNDCGLRDLEDARKIADYDRGGVFDRPATVTERFLLGSQGWAVPDGLVTSVDFVTASVAERSWTGLVPA